MADRLTVLEDLLPDLAERTDKLSAARFCRDKVIPAAASLRAAVDELETLTADGCRKYPTYAEILYSVR